MTTMTNDMDLVEVEDHVIAHQGGVIRATYDEAQADNCNYGWGISYVDDELVVETKLYGVAKILITRVTIDEPFKFDDEWLDYRP